VRVKPNQEASKEAMLLSLCKTLANSGRTIVFARTKVQAHRLKILFGLFGLSSTELHGNLTQSQRLAALESFRQEEAKFLIATDVAARGCVQRPHPTWGEAKWHE
jgi:ATP-dependent RNA helicase DDX27